MGLNSSGGIINSYNIGTVSKGTESSATYGGISGNGGAVSFTLPTGIYDYSVERFCYTPETGSVTVEKGTGAGTTTVTLAENVKHDLTFDITPADAALTVTHATQGIQTPVSGNIYSLYEGETYSNTIRQPGYVTVKDTVTIGSSDDLITIAMEEGVASWDGVTRTEPDLVDGVYQISDPEHLAWFSDKVNSEIVNASTSAGSRNSILNAILLNDIDLGDYEWTPIGRYGTYSNVNRAGYAGTFDGNDKTVSGLRIFELVKYGLVE